MFAIILEYFSSVMRAINIPHRASILSLCGGGPNPGQQTKLVSRLVFVKFRHHINDSVPVWPLSAVQVKSQPPK